jgi:hypothetical protein
MGIQNIIAKFVLAMQMNFAVLSWDQVPEIDETSGWETPEQKAFGSLS